MSPFKSSTAISIHSDSVVTSNLYEMEFGLFLGFAIATLLFGAAELFFSLRDGLSLEHPQSPEGGFYLARAILASALITVAALRLGTRSKGSLAATKKSLSVPLLGSLFLCRCIDIFNNQGPQALNSFDGLTFCSLALICLAVSLSRFKKNH